MRQTRQPRWIRTRFNNACIHCRQQINRHDDVLYYPDIKKVSCINCSDTSRNDSEYERAQEDAYFENIALSLGGNY